MSVFSDSAIQFSIRWPLRQHEAKEIRDQLNQLREDIRLSAEDSMVWESIGDAILPSCFYWVEITDYASHVCGAVTRGQRAIAEGHKEKWQSKLACFHKHFCSQCNTAQVTCATDSASSQAIRQGRPLVNPVDALAWALECIEQGFPDSSAPSEITLNKARDLKKKLEKHIGDRYRLACCV